MCFRNRAALAVVPLLLPLLATVRAAPVAMTGTSGSYTQRFDTLAASGTALWTNDVTLPGWHAASAKLGAVTNYATSTGSVTTASLYSFGASGASERALGSVGGVTPGDFTWGVVLRNDSGEPITNLVVAYTAEQWRNSAAAAQALTFACLVATNPPGLFASGYRMVPSLTFTSPVAGGSAGSLDGNQAANRAALTASFAVHVPTNQYILLRWADPDHPGTDHGLAMDDLTVTWRSGAAPFDGMTVTLAGAREDFATLGLDAACGLPDGWRADKAASARTLGTFDSAAGLTEQRAGTNMATNASAGIYNFGAGDAASAGDRALGGLSVGSSSKSVNIYARLRNDTGRTVSRWRVRYCVEKYRQGSNPTGFRMQLYAAANGSNWSVSSPAATVFSGDLSNAGYASAPDVSIAQDLMVTLPVPAGGSFYLAWNYSVAAGSETANAQALGLDDVEILPLLTGTVVVLQ